MQNYIFKCKCPNLVVALEICYFNNTNRLLKVYLNQEKQLYERNKEHIITSNKTNIYICKF